ncbi:15-hydroxyprostaglandin dehydrogenase [NAD(+)]-like [Ostrea edulis]|uniref:15-hydroxyprostaglandin dehydrogenase [NAD(+)]-like n=1 Tax=Ostrea edulis TaxID=37623 RepID=UPI002095081D|nr:15-hydroxyprostaglandin dehydrogenase [NAD(+)]-like [Ostrea edulis]
MLLDGKVALITGGAQGLGKAFAEELLKQKVKVCICDVKQETGEKTIDEWKPKYDNRAIFVKCDVSNLTEFEEAFKQATAKFGGLDIVVNNAGLSGENVISWRTIVIVNLIGVIEGTKLAEKYLNKQSGGRGGVVVNIGSTAGLTPIPYAPAYAASKYGVVGYTRSVALKPDTGPSGLRYVCLCPAFTYTSMFSEVQQAMAVPGHESLSKVVQDTGINKIEDVVEAFMQLLLTDDNNGGVMIISKKGGIQYHGRRRKVNKL